jgi:hypothetical protein
MNGTPAALKTLKLAAPSEECWQWPELVEMALRWN